MRTSSCFITVSLLSATVSLSAISDAKAQASSSSMLPSEFSITVKSPEGGAVTTQTLTAAPAAGGDSPTAQAEAEDFLAQVNYARVALAMKDATLARQRIESARAELNALKGATVEERRITRLPSGRILYQYETHYKPHYYPLDTGPIEVKTLKRGPMWAPAKGLAVTDAEVVYLTLDLNGAGAETHLNAASAQIDQANYQAADDELAALVQEAVKEESAVRVPREKAQDDLALAQTFIAAGNYEGARYAMDHAQQALGEMESDKHYASRKARVVTMRHQMEDLQQTLRKDAPTWTEKARVKLRQWWQELKDWAA
jgi:hypothetical protein